MPGPINTERPDGIVLDVHQVRRYPELLGILDQCFDVDAIRVLEHSLAIPRRAYECRKST